MRVYFGEERSYLFKQGEVHCVSDLWSEQSHSNYGRLMQLLNLQGLVLVFHRDWDLLLKQIIIKWCMRNSIKVISSKVDKSILLSPENPLFSLIWLHGLGDTSAGFLDYFQLQSSPVYRGGRVKLLHAPFRPVSINGGIPFPSWYDIRNLSGGGKEEERFNFDEVKESLAIIDKHVVQEIKFWKETGLKGSDQEICQRIFVGGFSQGCAMSLCYGLSGQRLIGGVIGFSGHLFESLALKNKEKVPLLVYHGDNDEMLNFSWVKQQYIKNLKVLPNFSFKLLQGLGHSVCEQQLAEASDWITQILKQKKIVQ